jgi:hypothetical protein
MMVTVGKAPLLPWDAACAAIGLGSVRQAVHRLQMAMQDTTDEAIFGVTSASRHSLYHGFRVVETIAEVIPELCLQLVVLVNSHPSGGSSSSSVC